MILIVCELLQNNVTLESTRSASEVAQLSAQVQAVQASVQVCAGVRQVETLAAVVEEQRLRIDSVILGGYTQLALISCRAGFISPFCRLTAPPGSTSIEPITREFQRLEDELGEIRAFFKDTGRRPLKEQLAEAGELIDVLSRRVSDVGMALGRAGLRLEVLEKTSGHFGECVHTMDI